MEKSDDLVWEPTGKTKECLKKDTITKDELKECLEECIIHATGDENIARSTLKKQASDAGVDWEDPDRNGLEKMIENLKDVSENFRQEEVTRKNYFKLKRLLDKCECD